MRHAVIIAGGSGTRLWPMSRAQTPKQLIGFMPGGKSLLQLAVERLDGLVPPQRRYICAGQVHREAILGALGSQLGDPQESYLPEPTGRDTLNAVGYSAAVIAQHDPDAVIAVFTADHLIEPVDRFRQIVEEAYQIAQSRPQSLVTFGITPTFAATGYGYLQLGAALPGGGAAFVVEQFKEKPDAATATSYVQAGPSRYLWNSGMFVWRASTLLSCIARYEPANHAGLQRVAQAWKTPQRQAVLQDVYPTLKKISVDYAVMERASKDPSVQVVAVPMPLTWLDVGSWPSFAQTCARDEAGNAVAAQSPILLDTRNTLVASSDGQHLIATIGLENLIIVHTPQATLICPADRAEDIKKLHAMLAERGYPGLL
jgi:mannose-1-phosphate guanylyltransferase